MRTPPTAAAAACLLLACTAPSRAELRVRSPLVEAGAFEFEHNGLVTTDHRNAVKDESFTYSLGLGITSFWKFEILAATQATADFSLRYTATAFENTFQLTPEHSWADVGLFFEYAHGHTRGSPDTVKFGPLVQKETPGFGEYALVHTLNLFLEREVGGSSTDRTGFSAAAQTRLLLHPLFQPGLELYAAIDDLGRAGRINDQQYSAGPVIAGGREFDRLGALKYEAGYLLGLTPATSHGAVRWRLIYSLAF